MLDLFGPCQALLILWQTSRVGLTVEHSLKSNISHFVKKSEINQVVKVLENISSPYKLKDIFDRLNGEIPYYKIRFALAFYYKHGGR